MSPCYVVFEGRIPGIYWTWHECSLQVLGYSDARYKKYKNYDQALLDYNASKSFKEGPRNSSIGIVLLCLMAQLMVSYEVGKKCLYWPFV